MQEETKDESFPMPEDVGLATSGEGFMWLRKYGITTREIVCNRLMWSESKKLLIFPCIENGSIPGWQARNFNPERSYKYLTRGDIKDRILAYGNGDTVVLVEDVVSAIKVARVTSAVPILGSVINIQLLKRINVFYEKVIIWLDPDKQKDAVKYAHNARLLGINASCVLSELDPKEHTDEYIREKLGEFLCK